MGWLKARLLALILPAVITLAALGLWFMTGRDAYTKYTVVERIEIEAADQEDDIFAQSGVLDENEPAYETVRRDEFHFGLLPTPQGLFDKHMVSVTSVAAPAWILGAFVFFLAGVRLKRRAGNPASGEPAAGRSLHETDDPE